MTKGNRTSGNSVYIFPDRVIRKSDTVFVHIKKHNCKNIAIMFAGVVIIAYICKPRLTIAK